MEETIEQLIKRCEKEIEKLQKLEEIKKTEPLRASYPDKKGNGGKE